MLSCDAHASLGGDIMLKPGYSLAENLEPLTRSMSVFKCASPAACEGQVGLANVTEGSDCAEGAPRLLVA